MDSLEQPQALKPPSSTAVGVAVVRAVHQISDGPPQILHDTISAKLVDDAALAKALATADKSFYWRLRAHVVMRSRFAEDRLEASVARGIKQCVILGAGLDTFAYRQPHWAREHLRVIEVDHPSSQQTKKQLLKKAGIVPPPNVDFVPIDFTNTTIADGLRGSSWDSRLVRQNCTTVTSLHYVPLSDAGRPNSDTTGIVESPSSAVRQQQSHGHASYPYPEPCA